jgi:glycosyltransferase involved in cell wall biosynthesis
MIISLLVPTRGRPENVARFLSSVLETASDLENVEVVLRVDEDDAAVQSVIEVCAGVQSFRVHLLIGPRLVLSDAWNVCYRAARGEALGFFADDVVFRTKGWDDEVRRAFEAVPDRIAFVHGRDGVPWHDEHFGTHGWLSRRWVEAVGRFFPPYFGGECVDTWVNQVADGIGRRTFLPGVLTEHLHPDLGKAPADATHTDKVAHLSKSRKLFDAKRAERTGEARKLLSVIASEGPVPEVLGRRSELVSVIVPCHEQGEYLLEAVKSIADQLYLRLEVVFACGDVFSAEVAHGPAKRLLDAHGIPSRVLSGLVHGRGDALNQAVSAACGRYIARLDADDRFVPEAIERMVGATDPANELAIAACNLEYFGDKVGGLDLGGYSPQAILEANYIPTCSLFSKVLWERAGGFDPALIDYEDWAFWVACSRCEPVVTKVHERLLRYRVHGAQASVFGSRNDAALKALVRMSLPSVFGHRGADVLEVVRCSEEVVDKVKLWASWFPTSEYLKRVLKVLSPEVRGVVMRGAKP